MPETEQRKHHASPELRFAANRAEAGTPAWPGTREGLSRLLSWGVPFALVVYLALRGGGYDAVVRLEAGIAIWLLVGAAALAGVIWRPGIDRQALTLLGVLVVFAAWTAASLVWTDSAERTMAEVARVVTYVGAFALLLSLPGSDRERWMVGGLAAAIAVIAGVALLSRLHPDWFGPNILAESQPLARARLAYPLDAWNGLATFVSLGFPLLLVFATEARRPAVQALAAASLPVLGLTTYLTYSRGGTLAAVAALTALFIVYPRRWDALVVGGVAVAGAAVLILATHNSAALADGLDNATARDQGDRILALCAVVCVVVAGARWAIQRRWAGYPPRPSISRSAVTKAIGVIVIAGVALAVAVDLPSKLADNWDEFKEPSIGAEGGAQRLSSASGNGRYQLWGAAIDAGQTQPLIGIGAGGFEYWWSRHATIPGSVRDAHSLYVETFGELGLVGLVLLGGFIVGVIIVGLRRARAANPAQAGMFAAAAAGAIAFAVALSFDWGWEIAVIPIAFLILAAAILSPDPAETEAAASASPAASRLATAVCAIGLLFVLVTSYVGVTNVRSSQDAFNSGDLETAIADAETAEDFQPYAASPLLQHALLLEQQGNVADAVPLAREAASKEPTNWRIWLTLSRLEVADGQAIQSVISYERARSLNPLSTLIPTADPRETHPDQFDPAQLATGE